MMGQQSSVRVGGGEGWEGGRLPGVHSTRRSMEQPWTNDYNMSGEYHLRLLTARQYKGDPSHPQ